METKNEYERTGEHFNIERKVVYDGKEYERTGRYFKMPSGTSALVYVDKGGKEYVLHQGKMTSIEEIKEEKEEKQEEAKLGTTEKRLGTTESTTEATTTEVALIPSEKELGTTSQERMTGFLQPVTSIDEAVRLFRLYEDAKTRILTDNDVIWIGKDGRPTEKGQGHPHIKRSGWRKLARFFGLSCKILERKKEWAEDNEGRYYIWTYKVRASHPCGAYQDAEGICTSRDPFFSKKHGKRIEPEEENIMMKAQTVAFNRAISDLLGSGEISAEEVE